MGYRVIAMTTMAETPHQAAPAIRAIWTNFRVDDISHPSANDKLLGRSDGGPLRPPLS